MKIVMLVPEAHGHVNPTLPLASALATRGHEVIFFLPETFAAVVQANGATLRPIEPTIEYLINGSGPPFGPGPSGDNQRATSQCAGLAPAWLRQTLESLQARIEAEAADCVIYDAFGFWLVDMARTLTGPKVAFFPRSPSRTARLRWTPSRVQAARSSLPGSWRHRRGWDCPVHSGSRFRQKS